MRTIRPLLTLGTLLAIGCDRAGGPASLTGPDVPAAIPALSVIKLPIEETVTLFEPSCAGEMLQLHIRQQLVAHSVTDANGGSHFQTVINDRGTTAIGLSSGTHYHQTGATTETNVVLGVPPLVVTVHNTLNLVSEGSAPNFRVNQLFHVTLNPAGDATAFTDVTSIVCQ